MKEFYRDLGLEGLEVIEGGEDEKGIIAPEDITGVHLRCYYDWLGFWRGDTKRVLAEYGTIETVQQVFGGTSPGALVQAYHKNLAFARSYSPEYVVFHVTNVSLQQSITGEKQYTDEEVIEGIIDLINQVFTDPADSFTLLFENLWWSGLTMTKPEITRRLLEGARYKNKGVMLDIGHLLHTNTSLRNLDEAVDYVHAVLDRYDDLGFIKGIHLHQSLSGEYVENIRQHPIKLEGGYFEKGYSLFDHIIKIDTHKPFLSEKIGTVLRRIDPEYVVIEVISQNREEHAGYIKDQLSTITRALALYP